jgi:DNA-directed RNA polymerase subunit RPC12/RpoP
MKKPFVNYRCLQCGAAFSGGAKVRPCPYCGGEPVARKSSQDRMLMKDFIRQLREKPLELGQRE